MSRQTNRAQAWLGSLAAIAGMLVLFLAYAPEALAQVPRERVFTANLGAGNITAFDTDKVQAPDAIDFRVPDNAAPNPVLPGLLGPTEIALNPMLQAGYVTEQIGASLVVFDPLSNDNMDAAGAVSNGGQIMTRIPLSIAQPFGVAVTPNGRLAFVGNAARFSGVDGPTQDMISVVDCDLEVEIATIDVSVIGALGPIDVAVSPDGALVYAACTGGPLPTDPRVVAVIDVATLTPLFTVLLPTVDTPFQIAVTPDNAFVYVACPIDNNGDGRGEVAFFDVPTLTTGLIAGLPGGALPVDVFVNRASSIVYICDNGNVLVLVATVATQSVITTVISFAGGPTFTSVTRGAGNRTDEFGYVTDNTASRAVQFSQATNVAVTTFPTDAGPVGIAVMALQELSAQGAAFVQRVRERREDRNKGLCFVATASYGQTDEVASLRAFRDLYLMPTKFGRSFVDLYYMGSPGVASVISSRDGVRACVREGLAPVVWCAGLLMHSGDTLLGGVAALLALAAGVVAGRRMLTRA